MIHKEGYQTLGYFLFFWTVVNGVICYALPSWCPVFFVIGLVIFLFLLQFFRNPSREVPNIDTSLIYAPADGKVVAIEEVFEPEFMKATVRMISIFMSPLNVHVTRMPATGQVVYDQYHPGKYLVAWHPKSSTENERHTTAIQNSSGVILIRQIAGAMARRIVNYARIGSQFAQGDDYGFIKFGSRVDIYLPLDFDIITKIGDVVTGKIDVIAKTKS